MIAYKLLRVRKDGSIGSLFVNRKAYLPQRRWMEARGYHTKGLKYRPGWHACPQPHAPHLSMTGRRWFRVVIKEYKKHERPECQGGLWFTARFLKILEAI
jgi:hypothetical protein